MTGFTGKSPVCIPCCVEVSVTEKKPEELFEATAVEIRHAKLLVISVQYYVHSMVE